MFSGIFLLVTEASPKPSYIWSRIALESAREDDFAGGNGAAATRAGDHTGQGAMEGWFG